MEVFQDMRIAAAERLSDGLVIEFLDGSCAFYSQELLYAMLPQAEELDETTTDW